MAKVIRPLGVNYHQCLVRRTPDLSLAPDLRGRLQVGSIVGKGPVRRVRVLKGRTGPSNPDTGAMSSWSARNVPQTARKAGS